MDVSSEINKINSFLFFIQWLVCCLTRLLVQLTPARRLPHRLQPAARLAFSLAEGLLSGRNEVSLLYMTTLLKSSSGFWSSLRARARTCLFCSLERNHFVPIAALLSFPRSLVKHPENTNVTPRPGFNSGTSDVKRILCQRASHGAKNGSIRNLYTWRKNPSLRENPRTNKARFIRRIMPGSIRLLL